MAVKRTVALAGVASAVLLAGSSAFAMANGIFGGRRADRVGSFQPIELQVASESKPVAKPTTPPTAPAVDPTLPAAAASGTPARSTDGGPSVRDVPQSPPGAFFPPANVRAPVAVTPDPPPGPSPTTVHHDDGEVDEHDGEVDEHESEDEVDDDHHGRDDDD